METSVNSYLTSMQNNTNVVEAQRSKANMGNSTIDKQSFLRLLMEQLKNQDPLNPQDNSQMLQQQAALTQVESLQNLTTAINSSNALMQSGMMVGKYVTVTNPDDPNKTITGKVTSATIDKGSAALEIGAKMYPMSSVVKINETPQ